ncbi:MAG: type I restriction endonuclease subunit R, partial [Anaerolineae bacterium]|nr:type I restriction endonuclease subunit R [Anaerolineae bacterium]
EVLNAEHEIFGPDGTLGRANRGEVVLLRELWPRLEALNPSVPRPALEMAVAALLQDRGVQSMVAANQVIYAMLRDGHKVTFRDVQGREVIETVRFIDWETPGNNHFLAVQQFWVTGELYTKRADVVCFVNGIPLVFIELKAHHKRVENAYRDNLTDYKATIPHFFWYTGFIILSNGRYSRIGSITSGWDHFAEWKKINSEGEEGIISLDTILRGTCDRARLLDILENFVLFDASQGGQAKLLAKNHQYLGVNNAVEALRARQALPPGAANRGQLGVFWHTQGSGKSYSMILFTRKVLRKIPGNWTFVIITDRDQLDEQIYNNFAHTGMIIEEPEQVRAEDGDHLKQLLREDHTFVFTLIQKFHTRDGQPYPVLSERDDIIVMTDEAHRSQYDIFAANMRQALPNAAFIGFTGTPLMADEERTRREFGDYISIYNFKQSADDGATVPLWYENRIPELQLTNDQLNVDVERVLEDIELDEREERALEREFAREYHVITRVDRLDTVAEDIAYHYAERGFAGRDYHSKAMVVCIDKPTAVRMYDLVQAHWQQLITAKEAQQTASADAEESARLTDQLAFMRATDMAVVVSAEQNEEQRFREKGLTIRPHRERMVREDLETAFKDPANPFRVVFVCAMWMTGFDAPSCSTIYLDKPMRNHTLMQTIARANRVFRSKPNGLIVDYIGVFRDLQHALAIYGAPTDGGEYPARDKRFLVDELRQAISEARAFCAERDIDLDNLGCIEGFERTRCIDDAVNALVTDDATKSRFFDLVRRVNILFKAILPDASAGEFGTTRKLLLVLGDAVRSEDPDTDISAVTGNVERVLDESIFAAEYIIAPTRQEDLINLSQVDFEALQERFASTSHKNTFVQRLRAALERKLNYMVRLNPSRMDFQAKYRQMIDEYNAGSKNMDAIFQELVRFSQDLNDEDQRAVAEQLSEEELAIFDLLTRPESDWSAQDRQAIKDVARDLLARLKSEKLVLDWRKRQQTQAAVRQTIEAMLDEGLPARFDAAAYQEKCEVVYQHIFDAYAGQEQSIYQDAA